MSQQTPKVPDISVDWTIDPVTQRTDSSPAFLKIAYESASVIAGPNRSLEEAKALALAILGHAIRAYKLAPQVVVATTPETVGEDEIVGYFSWNGGIYAYRAAKIKPHH